MRTIEFEGIEVTYDDRVTRSWKWQKAAASGDQSRMLEAMEKLFCGRDEEYADALCGNDDPDDLDTSADAMQRLVVAVLEDANAKN
jgi:hypothetical protein